MTRGLCLFACSNLSSQLTNINSQNQCNKINQSDYKVIVASNLIDKKACHCT